MSKVFDFHVHTSFKAFNSKDGNEMIPDKDLWRERCKDNKDRVLAVELFHGELNYSSQSHLNALAKANVKCVCTSIYPLERGFTRILEKLNISHIIGIILKVLVFILNKKELALKIVSYVSGFDKERVRDINDDKLQYYDLLKREHDFLVDVESNYNHSPKFKMIKSFSEIVEDKICKIMTVEGAQSFFSAPLKGGKIIDMNAHDEAQDEIFHEFINTTSNNIEKAKAWKYPPFIVTFCHHFYNHLAGHAPSFAGFIKFLLFQEGSIELNQGDISSYYNSIKKGDRVDYFRLGIRSAGWELIKKFLEKTEIQRRILLDTKHMSAHTRIQYHNYIKKHNKDNIEDQIPIIKTHTAVSGRKSLEDGIYEPIDENTKYEWFNSGSINLFDDEIVDIIESDGLIGIMLDEKRISAKAVPLEVAGSNKKKAYRKFKSNKKRITKLNKKIKRIECGYKRNRGNRLSKYKEKLGKKITEVKPVFLSMLFNQFFHIVYVYAGDNSKKGIKAWQYIAIGTDYDGLINPVDIYYQADELENFKSDLIAHYLNFKDKTTVYGKTYESFLYGLTIDKVVKDILWENAMRFLSTYYHDEYLLKKSGGANSI